LGLEEIGGGDLITHSQAKNNSRREPLVLEVEGMVYTSYRSLADAYKLPYYVVWQRINDYGYSPEDAVLMAGKSKKVFIEGKEYPSLAAVARAHGMTSAQLLGRLNDGRTLKQALSLEP